MAYLVVLLFTCSVFLSSSTPIPLISEVTVTTINHSEAINSTEMQSSSNEPTTLSNLPEVIQEFTLHSLENGSDWIESIVNVKALSPSIDLHIASFKSGAKYIWIWNKVQEKYVFMAPISDEDALYVIQCLDIE